MVIVDGRSANQLGVGEKWLGLQFMDLYGSDGP